MKKKKKRPKYYAKSVMTKYGKFDSQTEYERFLYLIGLQDRGIISKLKRQVRYEIIPKLEKYIEIQLTEKISLKVVVDERAAYYTCDFTYYNSEGQFIVEEVKSSGTKQARDYILRRKLIKQQLAAKNTELGYEKYRFNEICT